MNTYIAGTDIQLPINFTDDDGNPLSVKSATYQITDDLSNVIQMKQDFDLSQDTLLISSNFNQIESLDIDAITSEQISEVRLYEARIVEFDLVLSDGGMKSFDIAYIITPREKLIAGLNSFQSMRESYLTAMSISNSQNWSMASDSERVSAMIEAHIKICSFAFEDITLGQSYIEESTPIGDLSLIPPKDFKNLTPKFRKALRMAQLAEADEILGGGDQDDLQRRRGLISQTIGETQDVYRSSKVLDMQLSKTALRYLSSYISLSKRVGRA